MDTQLLHDRNMVALEIVKAMLINNELRHDLTKGQPLSRGDHAGTVSRIFDLADAVIAETQQRTEITGMLSSEPQ